MVGGLFTAWCVPFSGPSQQVVYADQQEAIGTTELMFLAP